MPGGAAAVGRTIMVTAMKFKLVALPWCWQATCDGGDHAAARITRAADGRSRRHQGVRFSLSRRGRFSRDGTPATAAAASDADSALRLRIMVRQVTAAEYARCVDDGGARASRALTPPRTGRWSA